MKAEKVKAIMPEVFVILRTHPLLRYISVRQTYLISRIVFLSLLHSTSDKSRAVYCIPSERYLAKAVDCTRETVSRNLKPLRKIGLLDIVQRRPHGGRWSTNLYRLGKLLWSMIQDVTTRFFAIVHRVTSTSHIVSETRYNSHTKDIGTRISYKLEDPPLEDILNRISRKMGFTTGN